MQLINIITNYLAFLVLLVLIVFHFLKISAKYRLFFYAIISVSHGRSEGASVSGRRARGRIFGQGPFLLVNLFKREI